MTISEIFGKKITVQKALQFISDIYYSGKLVELSSFIVWEIKYLLFFYRNSQILKFNGANPLRFFTRKDKLLEIKSESFEISKSDIDWVLVFIDDSQNLWGNIINNESTLFQFSPEGILINSFELKDKISGIYINKKNSVFCCAAGILYKLSENKKLLREVLKLSTCDSYFLQDAFTETPKGELFIGEYANIFENKKWKFVGYIYHSIDNGDTWNKIDFFKKTGVNKHIHILKWSNVVNGLIMTDGDNQKNIWLNKSNKYFNRLSSTPELGWKKLNKYHIQKGGYTGIAELNNKILFGTDYNGGTNFLISTKDMICFDKKVIPNPYRRSTFNRIAIRRNKLNKLEIWSNIRFKHNKKIKSLVMLSIDDGETWKKIIEYDGTQFEIDIISNSRKVITEIYLLIKDKKEESFTTLLINS
ncbi:hypothetical protein L3X39_06915 [Sabulilitoribacter multivorans]|uniref:BNR repeat-like domain-containing protein n=1 Tax=Flaviramulus multivorans TaxID=1304750 RepID=A0ABS9IHY0_9FLAO|nr:hypothetical protein [Flaviramulus multivorans]MCF7560368.1 hypothetical protein [Flaviramulus multivorans]